MCFKMERGPTRKSVYPFKRQTLTIPDSSFAFYAIKCNNSSVESTSISLLNLEKMHTTKNLDIINTAVLLFIKTILLVTQSSGRVRKQSKNRLKAMDVHTTAKKIIFERRFFSRIAGVHPSKSDQEEIEKPSLHT